MAGRRFAVGRVMRLVLVCPTAKRTQRLLSLLFSILVLPFDLRGQTAVRSKSFVFFDLCGPLSASVPSAPYRMEYSSDFVRGAKVYRYTHEIGP